MSTIYCWRCGLAFAADEGACEHCGAGNPHAGSGASTYASPSQSTGNARSPASKGDNLGCLEGTGCGCGMGMLSLMMGIGLAGIPVVGWILGVGFIGAAFLWPILGGWLGTVTPKE